MGQRQPSTAAPADPVSGSIAERSSSARDWQFSPGTLLGRWEIGLPLGRGGMGEVYRARDVNQPARVGAVKVLAARKRDSDSSHRRFLQEANTLARLDHPNVVGFYEVGATDDHQPYMVTELLDGLTLADLLDHQGRFDVVDSLDICAKIACGVAAAHNVGVLHRDLKPANVLVTISEAVKILDFGIAKPFQGTALSNRLAPSTDKNVIVGTWSSLSPEQILGKAKLGPATDIFALGALAYELISGRSPWADEDDELPAMDVLGMRILTLEPTPLPALFKGFPPEVWEVVGRSLHKQPAMRYPTMEVFGAALERARRDFLGSAPRSPYNLPSLQGRIAALRKGTRRLKIESEVTLEASSDLVTVTASQEWPASSDFQLLTPLTSAVTPSPPRVDAGTLGAESVSRGWQRPVAAMAATFGVIVVVGVAALELSASSSVKPASGIANTPTEAVVVNPAMPAAPSTQPSSLNHAASAPSATNPTDVRSSSPMAASAKPQDGAPSPTAPQPSRSSTVVAPPVTPPRHRTIF